MLSDVEICIRMSLDLTSVFLAPTPADESKKRGRVELQGPPQPSGWLTSATANRAAHEAGESEAPKKRSKLSDLVEARKHRFSGKSKGSPQHETVTIDDEDDVLDVVELSSVASQSSLPSSKPPSHAASKPSAKTSKSTLHSKKPVNELIDDDMMLISSDDEVKPKTASRVLGGKLRRLKKASDSDTESSKAPKEESSSHKSAVRPKSPPKEEIKTKPKRAPAAEQEGSDGGYGSGGDNTFSDGEYEEDKMVKFDRIVTQAQKMARQVGRYLTRADDPIQRKKVPETAVAFAKPIKHFVKQPQGITRPMKDYQITGLNWMRLLHLQGCNGILADEMGLGKTIQTISLLCWLQEMTQRYDEHIHNPASEATAATSKATNSKSKASKKTASVSTPAPETAEPTEGEATSAAYVANAAMLDNPAKDHLAFSAIHNTYPTLIVAPASTLENWKRELDTWAPSLRTIVFHGNFDERETIKEDIKHHWKRYKEHFFDVMISTYQTIGGKYDSSFFTHGIRFNYLVVDEAQMLKGNNTARFTQLTQVRAAHRLMLTGTPLQNNLDELQSLLAFLMPNLFGRLIGFTMSRELAEHRKAGKKVLDSEYVTKLKELLMPFILRRLKSQVGLGLLPKIHTVLETEATELQERLNRQIFSRTKMTIETSSRHTGTPPPGEIISLDDSDSVSSGETKGAEEQAEAQEPAVLSNGLMQLRHVANHVIFIRAFYTNEQLMEVANVLHRTKHKRFKNYTIPEIMNDLSLTSDWDIHHIAQEYPASLKHLWLTDDQLFRSSAKLLALAELLPRLKSEGHRIVLFSQFTTVLDLMELFLDRELKMGYVRMDGSTSVSERQVRMDLFNTNKDTYTVFLASTLAGGLGVNLTSADTVIFFDISFNPHVDRQAEDRCHRLGQEKQVTVYNLLVPGTIEVHMHKMASAKTELNDVMLNEGSFAEKEAARMLLQESTAPATTAGPASPLARKTSAELMFMKQVARSISTDAIER